MEFWTERRVRATSASSAGASNADKSSDDGSGTRLTTPEIVVIPAFALGGERATRPGVPPSADVIV
jgi:hypothetical protein